MGGTTMGSCADPLIYNHATPELTVSSRQEGQAACCSLARVPVSGGAVASITE